MNDKLILSPEAQVDIDQAFLYYEKISVELSEKFLISLNDMFSRISEVPTASAIRYHNVRTKALPIFPYTIHYSIIKDKIFVARIFNTYQRPFW